MKWHGVWGSHSPSHPWPTHRLVMVVPKSPFDRFIRVFRGDCDNSLSLSLSLALSLSLSLSLCLSPCIYIYIHKKTTQLTNFKIMLVAPIADSIVVSSHQMGFRVRFFHRLIRVIFSLRSSDESKSAAKPLEKRVLVPSDLDCNFFLG